jgi:hypothetical protein
MRISHFAVMRATGGLVSTTGIAGLTLGGGRNWRFRLKKSPALSGASSFGSRLTVAPCQVGAALL